MENQRARTQEPSRRSILIGAASGLSSAWLMAHLPSILAAQKHAHAVTASGLPGALNFFSRDEGVEIEAVAAQIIPKDDTAGAREAGTIYFIDRILTTFEQDKRAVYTQGLQELRAKTHELFPTADKFSNLKPDEQIQVLKVIEKSAFFEQVRLHTIVGFFANPEYGGNQDKIGWNLIGFEDKFDWQPPFGHYDGDERKRS